jgi:hypothetical protein
LGGDDGLGANVNSAALVKAAKRIGFYLTVEKCTPGNKLLPQFLSRFYGPSVWHGVPDSCCDIRRQLSKFHLTANLVGVSPTEKLIQKARAYVMTDAKTPLIGRLSMKILALANLVPDDIPYDKRIASWWSKYDRTVQYPQEDYEWMDDVVQTQLPMIDQGMFNDAIDGARTLDDVLRFPQCWDFTPLENNEVDVPAIVEVGDTIMHPKHTSDQEVLEDDLEQAPTRSQTRLNLIKPLRPFRPHRLAMLVRLNEHDAFMLREPDSSAT